LADPAVSDILVNAPDQVYVERFAGWNGPRSVSAMRSTSCAVIERIAARVGRRIDTSSRWPICGCPTAARVNATLPPVTIDGPTLVDPPFRAQAAAP
jgi:pilus assembly protein CpaF